MTTNGQTNVTGGESREEAADLNAILAELDEGAVVLFAQGFYKLTQNLTLPAGVSILIDGTAVAIDGADYELELQQGNVSVSGSVSQFTLDNITLSGGLAAGATTGRALISVSPGEGSLSFNATGVTLNPAAGAAALSFERPLDGVRAIDVAPAGSGSQIPVMGPALDLGSGFDATILPKVYQEMQGPMALTAGLLSIRSELSFRAATITVTDARAGDSMSFTPDAVALADLLHVQLSYDAPSGVLSITPQPGRLLNAGLVELLLEAARFDNTTRGPGDSRQFTYTLTDKDGATLTANAILLINDVNEAPALGLNAITAGWETAGATAVFVQGGGAVDITTAASITLTDADGDAINTVTVRITDVGDRQAESLLLRSTVQDGDLFGLSPATIAEIAGVTVAYDAATATLTLSASAALLADNVATTSLFQYLLNEVKYANSAENPSAGGGSATRTIEVVASDARVLNPTSSEPLAFTISLSGDDLTPINDAANAGAVIAAIEGFVGTLDAEHPLAVAWQKVNELGGAETAKLAADVLLNRPQAGFATFAEVAEIVSLLEDVYTGLDVPFNAELFTLGAKGSSSYTLAVGESSVKLGAIGSVTFSDKAAQVAGNGAFTTIREAINASGENDTILVAPGAYAENVTLNKGVTVLGANAGTPGEGERGVESTVQGAFIIAADGITIDGMRFDGGASAIRGESGNRAYDDLTIINNVMVNSTDSAIRLGLGSGGGVGSENWVIAGNKIDAINGNNLTAMVLFNVTGLTVTDNVINHDLTTSTGRRGINLDGARDATVSGNTVNMGLVAPTELTAATPWGILISMSDRTASTVAITDNEIGGTNAAIISLSQRSMDKVVIAGNTIDNVVNGIQLNSGAAPVFAPGAAGVTMEVAVTGNTISAANFAVWARDLHDAAPNGPVTFKDLDVTGNTVVQGVIQIGRAEAAGNGLLNVAGTVRIDGTARADVVQVEGTGVVIVNAGEGDDRLIGGAGNDTLTGGAGNDLLDGGAGDDILVGGPGDDTYVVDSAGDVVVEAVGGGFDTVNASVSYTLGAGVEVEALNSTGTGLSLSGNEFAQTITGDSGNNTLKGGGGDDLLVGGAGTDTALFDTSLSPANLMVRDGRWVVQADASEGTDTLDSIEIVAGAGGERFLLVSAGGFATIQAAVNAADAGDVILVAPGTYAENVVVGKDVTIIGAGKGDDPATATIIDPASGDGFSFAVGSAGASLQSLRITGAATAIQLQPASASEIVAGNVVRDLLFRDIAVVDNTGTGINFRNGTIGDVTIENSLFSGNSVGVRIPSSGTYGTVTITDSVIADNGTHGFVTLGASVANVVVTDSAFANNGTGGATGQGDLVLFSFNGDATLKNLTISGDGTGSNALQISGPTAGSGAEPDPRKATSAIGTVSVENVTITGSYARDVVFIGRYRDLDGLEISGLDIQATTGWTQFNIFNAGGDIDLATYGLADAGLTTSISSNNGVDFGTAPAAAGAVLKGGSGNDTLVGHVLGDTFVVTAGSDVFVGGAGIDTVVVGGGLDLSSIGKSGANLLLTANGTHILQGIERLSFTVTPEEAGPFGSASDAGDAIIVSLVADDGFPIRLVGSEGRPDLYFDARDLPGVIATAARTLAGEDVHITLQSDVTYPGTIDLTTLGDDFVAESIEINRDGEGEVIVGQTRLNDPTKLVLGEGVTRANTAPVLVNGNAVVAEATSESLTGATLDPVSVAALNSLFRDDDVGSSVAGIAVVGIEAPDINGVVSGRWQFKTGDDAEFRDLLMPSVGQSLVLSESAALLLTNDTQLRFVLDASSVADRNFGRVPELSFVAVDSTQRVQDGAQFSTSTLLRFADVSVRGGASPYSAEIATYSRPVTALLPPEDFTVPVITYPSITEDSQTRADGTFDDEGGATVASIFGTSFGDATTVQDLEGIVIVGNPAVARSGVWQYRLKTEGSDADAPDFTAWVTVGAVTPGSGLFLAADAELRFVPNWNFNGSAPALTVRGVADAAGLTTDAPVDATSGGFGTRFSASTATLGVQVEAVDDQYVMGVDGMGQPLALDVSGTPGAVLSFNGAPVLSLLNFDRDGGDGSRDRIVFGGDGVQLPDALVFVDRFDRETNSSVNFVSSATTLTNLSEGTVSGAFSTSLAAAGRPTLTFVNSAPVAPSFGPGFGLFRETATGVTSLWWAQELNPQVARFQNRPFEAELLGYLGGASWSLAYQANPVGNATPTTTVDEMRLFTQNDFGLS